MIVAGAVGCSSVNDALNQSDRNSFVTSANSFTKAYMAMGAAASANVADPSKFPAAAQPSIDAMKHQVTEMSRLAGKVTGKAQTIATKLVGVATKLVGGRDQGVGGRDQARGRREGARRGDDSA